MPFEHHIGDSSAKINTSEYGLSRRQRDCLAFLRSEIDRTGVTPSYEEIMIHLGLKSKSGVHRLIHALRAKGRVQFLDHRARSLRVLQEPMPVADAIERILATCTLSSHTQTELRAILGAET